MPKKLLFIILLFVYFVIGCLIVNTVSAQTQFKPQISVGESEFQANMAIDISGLSFANYIIAFYQWSVRAIAILAVIMIMVAGFRWVTSAGNAPAISKAKDQMISAIIGLVLAIGANLFLYAINPSLVNFKPIAPTPITTIYLKPFCKDLSAELQQTITGYPDALKGKDLQGVERVIYSCGKNFEYKEKVTDPTTKQTKEVKKYCYGDYCWKSGGYTGKAQVCDMTVGDGACLGAQEYCRKQKDQTGCQLVDQTLVTEEPQFSCRRCENMPKMVGVACDDSIINFTGVDICLYSRTAPKIGEECAPGTGIIRVKCEEGVGTTKPCWEPGVGPKDCADATQGWRAKCTDSPRANHADGICCRPSGGIGTCTVISKKQN